MPFKQQAHVFPGTIGVAGPGLRGQAEQSVRSAAQRRHHNNWPARIRLRAGLNVRKGGLAGGADDLDKAGDCRLVRHGRAAELQDKHWSSACINSALRIDAPAAPRTVL